MGSSWQTEDLQEGWDGGGQAQLYRNKLDYVQVSRNW